MKYYEEFIQYLRTKGTADSSVYAKGRYLEDFHDYLTTNGIADIEYVTSGLIEEYKKSLYTVISAMTKRKLSHVSIRMKLTAVKLFFKYLSNRGYVLFNPAADITVPCQKKELPNNLLNEQEIAKFIEQPDITCDMGIRDRAILELMYSTGMRKTELRNLDIYDIDLHNRTARINKGKGRKDRVVPLGKLACLYIGKYLREVHPKWTSKTGNKALFIGGMSLGRLRTIDCIIKRYKERLFPEKIITCHSIRHCCALHMLRGGADIRIIQKLLGHSSLNSTQVYTRLSPAEVKAEHRKCFPRKLKISRLREVS